MEKVQAEELRHELNQLLQKPAEILETRRLGTATDTQVLEYEIRQEVVHELCNQLANSVVE
jgi:hypothetical protein